MSMSCLIETIVNLEYTADNIKIVLNRGKKIGIEYYMGLSGREIGIDEAVYTIMHNDHDAEEMVFLMGKFNETEINLYCNKTNENKLIIVFSPAGYAWKKKYKRTTLEEFDIKRYLDIIFEFLQPFKILKTSYEVYW